jgi:hypothetical protein
MDAVMERNTLHRLVDMLPEGDLDAAQRVLRGLLGSDCDPVLLALLNARVDDEPFDEEDIAADAEADADIAARRLSSHEAARRRLLGNE